jgi:hypothetical protein
MKNTQKVTRVKLDIEHNNDYVLLGLVTTEPDYKLSLSINKKFGISLRNISPIKINGDNKSEQIFSRFSNNDDRAELVFYLVSNRSDKGFLLNKLKNIDYLLQIQTSEREINLNLISAHLREIDTVTAVFNIDADTIKDKNLHYLTQ